MRLPPNVTRWEWDQARRVVLAYAEVCAICGDPLIPEAAPRSRMHTEVDHRLSLKSLRHLPLELQRQMALDPTNLQASHKCCNVRKGARRGPRRPQSQNW